MTDRKPKKNTRHQKKHIEKRAAKSSMLVSKVTYIFMYEMPVEHHRLVDASTDRHMEYNNRMRSNYKFSLCIVRPLFVKCICICNNRFSKLNSKSIDISQAAQNGMCLLVWSSLPSHSNPFILSFLFSRSMSQ